MARTAGAYPGFRGVTKLSWAGCLSRYPQQRASGTHLYTWVEKDDGKVFGNETNTIGLAIA